MAAPTPTARVKPTVAPMKDGYRATITFAVDPDIVLWERQVKPPGVDGGEPIDISNMHNDEWLTFAPQSLAALTPCEGQVAYTALSYSQVEAIKNVNTTITVTFSTGGTVCFYGYLKSFEPDALQRGVHPEAAYVIQPTNFDPVNNVEAGPAYAGT